MINLPNVTLWSCLWNEDVNLLNRTVRVMRYVTRHIQFGRVVLFTHLRPPTGPDGWKFEAVQVPRLTGPKQFDHFVVRWIPRHLTTEFAMSVHEDGFPIDFTRWKPEFLSYDWIGAPWDDGVVGNGGFYIESQRILQLKPFLPFEDPADAYASDYLVCRKHRALLERQGITFAPQWLAMEFSTEQIGNAFPSFGFHGRTWATEKYAQGWKRIEKEETECK